MRTSHVGLRIAIVGIGVRTAGASSPHQLWRNLSRSAETLTTIPTSRFDPSTLVSDRGGFIDRLGELDAEFFGISPREVECMDPAARTLLEVVWECCEDAGIPPSWLRERRVGTYVGAMASDFERLAAASTELADIVGRSRNALASRVGYVFGLRGPALVIDSDRSSSLVALDAACRDLRHGRVDAALVCGASVIVDAGVSLAFNKAGLLSPEGRCKFGDADANGFVRSEGIACVLLLPEDSARRSERGVYATIVGTSVNNEGGRGEDYLTPSVAAQVELLRQALADAELTPADIGCIEAHGTGTPVGDSTELRALAEVFADVAHPIHVGSLKSNIGHTEACAGLLGVIKAALSLQNGLVPKTLHVEVPNPSVAWCETPLRLARDALRWPSDLPPRVGVSAFGLTGANAHCVLERAEPLPVVPRAQADRPRLMLLSAPHEGALRALAKVYAECETLPELDELADGLLQARERQRWRLVGPASSTREAREEWRKFTVGDPSSMQIGRALNRPKIVFVCPGQGAQWPGMGRHLWDRSAVFRTAIEEIDDALAQHFGYRVSALWEDPAELERIDRVQPMLFAMSVALGAVWRERGVVADAVIGTSMGEIAAAVLSGSLSVESGARMIAFRSGLLARLSGHGTMISVLGSRQTVESLLVEHPSLSVAVYNGPAATVVAGDADGCTAFARHAEAIGLECRYVQVNVASHSAQVDGILDELSSGLSWIGERAASASFVSTVRAQRVTVLDAAYFCENLRRPVRLAQTTDALLRQGYNVFIELSPHEILTGALIDCASEAAIDAAVVGSMMRDTAADESLLRAEARLVAVGALPLHASGLLARSHRLFPVRPWVSRPFPMRPTAAPLPVVEARAGDAALPASEELFGEKLRRIPEEGERAALIAAHCAELVRSVVRWPKEREVPHNRGFRELGLTSVMMVEVRTRLSSALGRALPATYFFEQPTIAKVAGELAKADPPAARSLLGDILLECGVVSPQQLAHALRHQQAMGGQMRLGEVLLRLGFVTPEQLQRALTSQLQEPIALIGMAMRFPGGVGTPEAFWDLLVHGRDAIAGIPDERWDPGEAPDVPPFGGFLDDVRRFDFAFFGISKREAERMDPQQRLLLELAWNAFEHARIDPNTLQDSQTGVFVGVSNYNEYARLKDRVAAVTAFDGSGDANSILAGRLSYNYGLRGPAIAVDTACSSSLVALHLASQSLKNQECNLALVAGVNLILTPHASTAFARAGMLAPDGRCKPFDARANGYVRSEGCAVVVLKRSSDARAAGDRIWALLDATAINQDGRSAGLTAPNGEAQESLLRAALARASLAPSDVSYVEAHGTGTRLGDPIEVHSLARVYGRDRSAKNPLFVGSVKSNLGHLEAAAGIAGLIKTVLALNEGVLPPSLHFEEPNPAIDWSEHRVTVVTHATPWPQKRRIAGVSSFGFSGTNAHVLVEAPPTRSKVAPRWVRPAHPFLLTASDHAAMLRVARAWADYVERHGAESIGDVAHTLNSGRPRQKLRIGFAAATHEEAVARFRCIERGETNELVDASARRGVRLRFLRSSDAYAGQGAELRASSPEYREIFDAYAQALGTSPDALLDECASDEERALLSFASSKALFDCLTLWSASPASVHGEGIGLIAASLALGTIATDDACVAARAVAARLVSSDVPSELEELVRRAMEGERGSAAPLEPDELAIGQGTNALMSPGEEWRALSRGLCSLAAHDALASFDGFDVLYGLERLSGPPYPFADTRVWCGPELKDDARGGAEREEGSLLGRRSQREDGAVVFTRRIRAEDFAGHQVYGETIVPATALLVWLHAAAETVLGDCDLSSATIDRAVRLDGSVVLTVEVDPSGDARVLGPAGTQHASARALRAVHPIANCTADVLCNLEERTVDYDAFARRGLRYRGAYRALESFAVSSDSVVARVASPDPVALLDGCLQSLLVRNDGVWMPIGVERFWIRALPTAVTSRATVRRESAQHLVADVSLYGEDGQLLGELHGTSAQRVTRDRLERQGSVGWLYEERWQAAELRAGNGARASMRWLVLANAEECAALEERGHHARRITTAMLSSETEEPLLWIVPEGAVPQSVGELSNTMRPLIDDALTVAQWASKHAQHVSVVTSASYMHAPLWGIFRSLDNERPELRCRLIERVDAKLDVVCRELEDGDEPEVRLEGTDRSVKRLVDRPPDALIPPRDASNYCLECDGSIDGLHFASRERAEALNPTTVEIAVEAVGLNFHDVLTALSAIAVTVEGEDALGTDAAGVVTRVGSEVTNVAVGDRVYGLFHGGAIARYVLADSLLVRRIPERLSGEQAASVPSVFASVLHSLREADLKRGERILIHAATGGVGLAALQLARRAGAVVHATAGSEAKRAYLRSLGVNCVYDSRNAEFEQEILNDTNGEGVDVVLNSLSGELLDASLRALRRGGRFVELGRRAIRTDAEMRAARPDVAYLVINVAKLTFEAPDLVGRYLDELDAALTRGELDPLPLTIFPFERADEAFAHFSRAKHIGKIVLQRTPIVRSDRTYLVVGGKRGIGTLGAERLVEMGARRIVLLGRSESDQHGRASIERMRQNGATVRELQADVANEVELDQALAELAGEPLAGVLQSAGVLSDAMIDNQTVDDYERVFGPKVRGTWLLQSKLKDLDFFVCFSSIAALLGPKGQSNYAAACAFEDGLVRAMRAEGRTALSIQWGAWAEIGMAARLGAVERAASSGIEPIVPAAGSNALDILLRGIRRGEATCFASPMRWEKFSAVSEARRRTVFSGRTALEQDVSSRSLVEQLRAMDAASRTDALIDAIVGHVRQVLDRNVAVPVDMPLMDLGLDSLMAVELRGRIGRLLGTALPATLMFDYPTAAKIADYLLTDVLALADRHVATTLRNVVSSTREPIAIVGLACRFPGGRDADGYWALLQGGKSGIVEVPKERWDIDAFYDPDPATPHKMATRFGGFLEGIDEFDADFFGITPREAVGIDPQQRLVLEHVELALEDAGIDPTTLHGSRTGVFVGITTVDYVRKTAQASNSHGLYDHIGNTLSFAAGRVSYTYGLQGPSVAIETACSSSLVALAQAHQALRFGTCDLAIVCGVNLIITPEASIALSQMRTQAPDGQCKTFDARADGYVRAEGCGVVVLERLRDAEGSGARVRAIVRGAAVNQDGRSSGITAPNGPAQQALIEQALVDAGVAANEVEYIEAHGTGTSLGDPIEVQALAAVYGRERDQARPLLVGSVKTNIGHAESAAGIASLIKVVLMLEREQIVPHRNLERLSPHVPWPSLPISVPTRVEQWPRAKRARVAAISSFGISGTNAHVIVQEAPSPQTRAPTQERPLHVLVLSARTEPALQELKRRYAAYLKETDAAFPDIAHSASVGRAHHAWRVAVVAKDAAECRQKLERPPTKSGPRSTRLVLSDQELRGEPSWQAVLEKVATAYESGADIDWAAFDAGYPRTKVALPSYPFERRRYWIEASARPSAERALTEHDRLLGVRRELPWSKDDLFEARFDVSSLPGLVDHLVYGEVVVAGMVHLARLLGIARRHFQWQSLRFEEVDFDRALVLRGAGRLVQAHFAPSELGKSFEIYSRDAESSDDPWIRHAAGRVCAAEWQEEPRGWDRLRQPRSAELLYESLKSMGVDLGPAFRWVEAFEDVDGVRRARLRPAESHEKQAGYELAPGLFDAVMEATVTTGKNALGALFLPVHVGSVAIKGQWFGEALLCEVHPVREDDREREYRVYVWSDGTFRMQLTGVRFRRASPALIVSQSARAEDFAHRRWELDAGARDEARIGSWIVIGDARIADWVHGRWLHGDADDALRQAIVEADGVIFSPQPSERAIDTMERLRRVALAIRAGGVKKRLVVLTQGAHDGTAPALSSLWGMSRSLQRDSSLIESVRAEVDELSEASVHECVRGESDVKIAGGQRYVLRYARGLGTAAFDPTQPVEADGVYVITGGTSGLGLELAKWLAAKGAKGVVAFGRRDTTVTAGIEWVRGDVANRADVERLFAKARQMGRVRGVIHAAGIVDDALFWDLGAERMRSVLGPKADGLSNLLEACGSDVDYLIVLSSLTVSTGNMGQSAYGAANAYAEALAASAAGIACRARVLALGPVAQVGMADRLDAAHKARLREEGVSFATVAEVCSAIEKLLEHGSAAALFAKVDWEKHPAFGRKRSEEQRVSALAASLGTKSMAERESVLRLLVRETAANVLGRRNDEIEEDQPLMELGVDSLMAVQMREKLSLHTGLRLPATIVFDHPTTLALAQALVERLWPGATRAVEREAQRKPLVRAADLEQKLAALRHKLSPKAGG